MKFDFKKTQFLKSAYKASEFPGDFGNEIAFVGRSNSGKSSLINALTKQKNLARSSKTPGRTQVINFFQVIDNLRLVDLPGYGFAKVPPEMQKYWQELIQIYFATRSSLKGVVVLMDSRHPLSALDQQLIHWIKQQGTPLILVLSKTDKLNRHEIQQTTRKVTDWLVSCGYMSEDSETNPTENFKTAVVPCSVEQPSSLEKLSSLINVLV